MKGRAADAKTVRIFVDAAATDTRLIVREAGRVFDVPTGNSGRTTLTFARAENRSFATRNSKSVGFAGGLFGWQQSDDDDPSEEFADMFIGWVYNQWGTNERGGLNPAGAKRATVMNANAPRWIELAVDFTKKAGKSPNK